MCGLNILHFGFTFLLESGYINLDRVYRSRSGHINYIEFMI
jgi:hypothetical protein